ncbi:hypothetical protein ACOMHN_010102 [Nucella lapillus]
MMLAEAQPTVPAFSTHTPRTPRTILSANQMPALTILAIMPTPASLLQGIEPALLPGLQGRSWSRGSPPQTRRQRLQPVVQTKGTFQSVHQTYVRAQPVTWKQFAMEQWKQFAMEQWKQFAMEQWKQFAMEQWTHFAMEQWTHFAM